LVLCSGGLEKLRLNTHMWKGAEETLDFLLYEIPEIFAVG